MARVADPIKCSQKSDALDIRRMKQSAADKLNQVVRKPNTTFYCLYDQKCYFLLIEKNIVIIFHNEKNGGCTESLIIKYLGIIKNNKNNRAYLENIMSSTTTSVSIK